MKKEIREQVWLKYKKRCAYCGKLLAYKDMQVDHLTPHCLGHYYNSKYMKEFFQIKGKNIDSFENLMPSCRRCNHYKRAHTLDQFRALMVSLHDRVNKQYITKVAIDYGIVSITPFTGTFYFEKCENFTPLKD